MDVSVTNLHFITEVLKADLPLSLCVDMLSTIHLASVQHSHTDTITIIESLYSPSKHGRQQTISNTNEIKQL